MKTLSCKVTLLIPPCIWGGPLFQRQPVIDSLETRLCAQRHTSRAPGNDIFFWKKSGHMHPGGIRSDQQIKDLPHLHQQTAGLRGPARCLFVCYSSGSCHAKLWRNQSACLVCSVGDDVRNLHMPVSDCIPKGLSPCGPSKNVNHWMTCATSTTTSQI